MRFIGKWLIWIGGSAWLYLELSPMVEEAMHAYRSGTALGPYTVEEWLMRFAKPVFVLGVICAAALPDLERRRARKKSAPAPLVPPPPAVPPTAPPAV
jgi:hypothetical protein